MAAVRFPYPRRVCRSLRHHLSRGRPEERQELTSAIHRPPLMRKDLRGSTPLLTSIDNMSLLLRSIPDLTQKNAFERTKRTYL